MKYLPNSSSYPGWPVVVDLFIRGRVGYFILFILGPQRSKPRTRFLTLVSLEPGQFSELELKVLQKSKEQANIGGHSICLIRYNTKQISNVGQVIALDGKY
jgi:hypothetical protein